MAKQKLINNKLSNNIQDKVFWVSLILPVVLIATFFILVPVADSVIKSFLEFRMKNIVSGEPGTWNNFDNYYAMLNDNRFWPAIKVTFLFVIMQVSMQFILGMALALLLNSNIKCARFIRSIMMTPWVVPTVISALIWMWIFQSQYGVFKYFVDIITNGRITDFAILNNPETALIGVSIAALWKQIPLMTLLLLAGLQNVPDDVLEAAKIDGANGPTRLIKITIPYMSSVIKVAVSMSIIDNFKQFPLFWIMTGGGPMDATTNLAILSYREAFIGYDLGTGAVVTTIWMLLMMLVVVFYNKIFKVADVN